MTTQHHPAEELLLGYAAASLAEPIALVIATHLALCPACRETVQQGEAMGGVLLEGLAGDVPDSANLQSAVDLVLARAARGETPNACPRSAKCDAMPILPQPIRGYVGGDLDRVAWKALGPGIQHSVVVSDRAGMTARLLRIAPGRAVFRHGHRGTELTLVLQGRYEAEGEQFARGDLEYADETRNHQPIAGTESICVCLAVTDAPLLFRNVIGRLMQPFLGI
jgi:putative transcriptional regulator